MKDNKNPGLERLMDTFEEDGLIRLLVNLTQNIHLRSHDAENDAIKMEMALRRFLKRIDRQIPPGVIWPSEYT